MSRSRPEHDSVNPAVRFFEWKGKTGTLAYYDKEKEENVAVDLPFTFLVLDQLNTAKGYDRTKEVGYYANEVRNNRDELTVRSKHGIVATGPWDFVKSIAGLKFCKSIYIAYKDGDELKLGNIQARGSFLGKWFEFAKEHSVMAGAVTVRRGAYIEKEPSYYEPEFTVKETTDETEAQARALDEVLQRYLDGYFSVKASDPADPDPPFSDEFPPTEDELATMNATVGGRHDPQAPLTHKDDIPF